LDAKVKHRTILIVVAVAAAALSVLLGVRMGRIGVLYLVGGSFGDEFTRSSVRWSLAITCLLAAGLLWTSVMAWRRQTTLWTNIFCAAVLLAWIGLGMRAKNYYHENPYGWDHCCIKQVNLALRLYAEEHNGQYPSGGATPEASLCLLTNYSCDVALLKGKAVPLAKAEAEFRRTGVLGPDSCGWHYVEGLNTNDDLSLAILWDKTPGFDHNSRRTGRGGREVAFLDGHSEWLSDETFSNLMARQAELLAQRNAKPK
jgi:hypothetical protein